jgi:hypothetical protein
MRKTILKFGFISGGILAAFMAGTLPFLEQVGDLGLVLGYTSMVLAFLMVYFGVRSYRDTEGAGQITFGRAFTVGIMISLIACVCYVATWEVIYYRVMPDFADKYAARVLESAKAKGATPQELEKRRVELDQFKTNYKKPLYNVAMTFAEPFPVALVITLVCSGLLSRRRKSDVMVMETA